MTNWLSLAVLSAFCLASADTVTKRYLSAYRPWEIVLVRFGFTGLLLLPLLLAQKWPVLTASFWGLTIPLVPLEILAMWLYMKAISESPLSLTLPFLAFTPVFNTVTGYFLLGEAVTFIGFFGIFLVVCGSWLLYLEHAFQERGIVPAAPFRAIVYERGSRLMLYVAALYSLTSVLGKAVLQTVPPAFFAPFYFVLLGIATIFFYTARVGSPWQVLARRPYVHLSVGFLMGGMVLAHFYAIEQVQVAYMIAVKRLSLLFGMVYGTWLFSEKGLVRNLIAGGLMVFGVYLIIA